MYTDTITLFNRKEGREGDAWYPTVIKGVHFNADRAAILQKYGANSSDNASLNIPYTSVDEKIYVSGKRWLAPKEWENENSPENAITFTSGTKFDFFWLGEWDNEFPVLDSAFRADTDFYTHMNRTHDFVFAITSASSPYSVIPHFEILGK